MATWHGFNIVDGVVAAFLLAGLIGGVRRGLSGELARATIAVACIAAAVYYTRPLADLAIQRWNLSPRQSYLAALVALVLGAYAVLSMIRVMLGNLMNFQFKGRLERLGGGLCGLLRASVVMSLLLLLLSLAPNDKLHAMIARDSFAGRRICPATRPMYESLSERVPELRVPETTAVASPDASLGAAEPVQDEPADDDLAPYPLPGESDLPALPADEPAVAPDAELGPVK